MFFEGAGFVIDPSGLIATNRHVIAGAYEITTIVPGFPPLSAKPVFISQRLDLAILKVDAGRPLPPVKFGDSDMVRIGDPVLLLGNPLGIGRSLSTGVISALDRDIAPDTKAKKPVRPIDAAVRVSAEPFAGSLRLLRIPNPHIGVARQYGGRDRRYG